MDFLEKPNLQTFHFGNLHPQILIGTAGDRYAGWIEQIYSQDSYGGRIIRRTRVIGASTYQRVKDLVDVGDVIEAQAKGVPGTITMYEVKGMGEPYNLHLREKSETLVALPEKLPVQILRINEKIVTGTAGVAWILKLCETSGVVAFEGELSQWEDVRLNFLNEQLTPMPGKVYAKVMKTKKIGDNLHEGHLYFTSVSPEIKKVIQRLIAE